MALSTKLGSFLNNTSTGNQAITGLGFQPKVILFFSGEKADPQGNSNDGLVMIGAAISSSNRFGAHHFTAHGFSGGYNKYTSSTTFCLRDDSGFGTPLKIDFVSIDSDGFTVNIQTTNATAYRVYYIALGGSDLSAMIGTFNINNSTGNQAITGVGFQPDAVLFFPISSANTDQPTVQGGPSFGIGVGINSSIRATSSSGGNDGAGTTQEGNYQVTSKCLSCCSGTGVACEADFVSRDSDGWTHNVTTAPGTTRTILYVALKGIQLKLGTFNQNTSTGNQAITGVGFQPVLTLFATRMKANGSSFASNSGMCIGGAQSPSTRFALGYASINGITTTQAHRRSIDTKCFVCISSGGSITVNAEADFVSNDSDGLTVNNTTAD